MTLNELAYQTIEAIRPEFHDDDVVDLRLVKELIHNQRSIWIRQELNKNRSIPEELIQDLGCVELEKASTAECCDFSSDCKILRTKLVIPKPINLHHRDSILHRNHSRLKAIRMRFSSVTVDSIRNLQQLFITTTEYI
jgi:hypothetical protein